MNKTAIAMLMIAAGIMAASCQKEVEPEFKSFEPMTINAVSEGIGTATKTQMIYKYDIAWSDCDKIYVTDGIFSDTFTLSGGAGTTMGTFTQDGAASFASEVQAYYPATMVLDGGLVWPANQTNDQTIPMYCSKTVSGKVEDFSFTSLGSVLQIVFNTTIENITLKSIEIKDGEKTMSGSFEVGDGGIATITATDKAGITLDLGESGVALGNCANYFYISVPAGNYQNLTLTFTATDGKICVMNNGKVNIGHNTVGRLTLTGKAFRFSPPDGALPGKFSVSATKQVYFSQGNLYAKKDNGGLWSWNFYDEQYDYNSLDVNCYAGARESEESDNEIDLFTWGYGDWSTKPTGEYYQNNDFTDWGSQIGDGNTWRTLTGAEWNYLFGTSSERSGKYKYGITVCGKEYCAVLLPDDWDQSVISLEDFASATEYSETTAVKWSIMEAAGAVCLPAAGYRSGSYVFDVNLVGNYWSSSAYEFGEEVAYRIEFISGNTMGLFYRNMGGSVRLVADVK